MWYINETEYKIPTIAHSTVVIDEATNIGYDIPRFCYQESLKVAGNCRMCLVEDSKAAKPVVACAMTLVPDLDIFLNTVRVKKARESVLEFLLINHPLDCPICDQGGECDLQDLTMVYGSDHGRFYEYKRNVEDKNCGSIVKMIMNRCILCTRCVRFATDIAKFEGFGITGRGVKSEIGSYIERIIDTDLSGNLIDICPVGALTSKPYSFASRPWELKSVFTFSNIDDEIQTIRADVKENELLRITPSKSANNSINWITNRVRYSYEGLYYLRKQLPIICGTQGDWNLLFNLTSSWLKKFSTKVLKNKIVAFDTNDLLISNDEIFIAKTLVNSCAFSYTLKENNNIFILNSGYNDLLLKGKETSYGLLNLDLNYFAPVLYLFLQQLNSTGILIFSWYSKQFYLNSIILDSSLNTLIKLLRFKTWHNIIIQKRIIFSNSTLSARFKNYNLFNVALNGSERSKWANLFNIATHWQNAKSLLTPISFTVGRRNEIPQNFSLVLSSHFSKFFDVFIPVATVYEQGQLRFYDTAYKINKSLKVVVTPTKTNLNVLKMFHTLFNNGKVSALSSFSRFLDYYSENRFVLKKDLAFFLPHNNFIKIVEYSRASKLAYYGTYSLTKNAASLRSTEQKNIYNNNTNI